MLDTVRATLEEAGLEVIDISLQQLVVRHNNVEASLSLQNLYLQLMQSPREQHLALVTHFVAQVIAHLGKSNSKQSTQIFPLLGRDVPDKRLHAPWSAPLLPNLLKLLLCEETEDRMRLLSPMDIVNSGKSMVILQKEAMKNLFSISSSVQPTVDILGQYRFEVGDGYDASRFLMIRHWFPKQEIWIAIPSRDSLWIRETPPDALAIATLREAHTELPYPLLDCWIQLPAQTQDPSQQESQ